MRSGKVLEALSVSYKACGLEIAVFKVLSDVDNVLLDLKEAHDYTVFARRRPTRAKSPCHFITAMLI